MATLAFPKSSHQSGFRLMLRNPHPKKERHGDCGTRAICLALGLDYQKVWNAATKMKQMNAPTYRAITMAIKLSTVSQWLQPHGV